MVTLDKRQCHGNLSLAGRCLATGVFRHLSPKSVVCVALFYSIDIGELLPSRQTLSGRVGYFSNEHGFTVESRLQGISSICCCGNETVSSNVNMILTRKHAARARARLRQANTERQKFILKSQFGICFQYQNVEETKIQVCALFGYLRSENRCAIPNCDVSAAQHVFSRELPSGSVFAST